MKQTLLALILLIASLHSFGQDMRCLSADHYLVETGQNEKRVNGLATVCYYGKYFSFYTKATNTVTFEVADPTTQTNKDGFVEETFINDENLHNARGDYSVEIVYGKTKTIVISFTKFGQAYMIQSNGFLGSPENDLNTKALSGNLKAGKLGFYHDATPTVDVSKWFLEHTDIAELKSIHGRIEGYFEIREDGSVENVVFQNFIFPDSDKLPASLGKRVRATLLKMPNWSPGMSSENKPVSSQPVLLITIP